MKPKTQARKCVAKMDKRAKDGLLDLTPLRAATFTVTRKKGGLQKVDSVEATDEEFVAYVSSRLRASFAEHRLGFRLLLLAACDMLDLPEGDEDA